MQVTATLTLTTEQAAEWIEAWEDAGVAENYPADLYFQAAVALRDAILQAVRGE